MWVRDRRALLQALALDVKKNEYLRNAASDAGMVVDYKDWQLPLGRRFRALKLWFVLRSFGVQGLRSHIRNGVEGAKLFENLIKGDPRERFELFVPRTLALVCFQRKL